MVLIPESASVSIERRRFRTVTLGTTSAVEDVAELTFLVNSSNGSRQFVVFSSKAHWFAMSVVGRSWSAV